MRSAARSPAPPECQGSRRRHRPAMPRIRNPTRSEDRVDEEQAVADIGPEIAGERAVEDQFEQRPVAPGDAPEPRTAGIGLHQFVPAQHRVAALGRPVRAGRTRPPRSTARPSSETAGAVDVAVAPHSAANFRSPLFSRRSRPSTPIGSKPLMCTMRRRVTRRSGAGLFPGKLKPPRSATARNPMPCPGRQENASRHRSPKARAAAPSGGDPDQVPGDSRRRETPADR